MEDDTQYEMTEEDHAFVDGLVELTAWCVAHPHRISELTSFSTSMWVSRNWGVREDDVVFHRVDILDRMRPRVRDLQDGAPIGAVTKLDDTYDYGVRRMFGPHRILVATSKEFTCQRVETDEVEVVETYEIPDSVREQYKVTTEKKKLTTVCASLFGKHEKGPAL